jgi:hypothetical protein
MVLGYGANWDVGRAWHSRIHAKSEALSPGLRQFGLGVVRDLCEVRIAIECGLHLIGLLRC